MTINDYKGDVALASAHPPRIDPANPRAAGPGSAQQYATRLVFFLGGLSLASWAPLVPYAQSRTGADPAELGLVMLCLGLGSICAIPFAGSLCGRLGCRTMIRLAALLVCTALPIMATSNDAGMLAFGLFLFGAAVGTFDVVVNIHALIVQAAAGRPMMPGFHALWSLGGFAGSALMSLLLSVHFSPFGAVMVIVAAIVVTILLFGRHLLNYGTEDGEAVPAFVRPRGIVLLIGVLCLLMYLTEEAMLDWTALFLTVNRGLDPQRGGLGYAMWSAAMMAGRFSGDWLVARLGSGKVVGGGGLLAVGGLWLAVVAPLPLVSIAGFGLVGLGMANIVPALYTAIGRQRVMPINLAMAAAATMGYTGTLIGPIIIGTIARFYSLGTSLLIVSVGLIVTTFVARRLAR